MTAPRHTILVVDDHPLFRKGVIQLLALASDFEVIGEAGDCSTSTSKAAADSKSSRH